MIYSTTPFIASEVHEVIRSGIYQQCCQVQRFVHGTRSVETALIHWSNHVDTNKNVIFIDTCSSNAEYGVEMGFLVWLATSMRNDNFHQRPRLFIHSPNKRRTLLRTLSFSGSYGWSLLGISRTVGKAAVYVSTRNRILSAIWKVSPDPLVCDGVLISLHRGIAYVLVD